MKKIILVFSITFIYFEAVLADTKIKTLYEGNVDAKISILVYESLTCSHCADFHTEVYPKLKKDFIDTGLLKIEFKNSKINGSCLNIMVKRGNEVDLEYSKKEIIKKMNIFFGYNVVDDIKLKTFEGEFEKIKDNKINNATKSKNIKKITNIKNDKIKQSLLELNKLLKSR